MKYNLKDHSNKVEIYHKAVGQHSGLLTINSTEQAGSLGFGFKEGKHSITCEAESLSEIIKRHPVDIIKMDCEGAEKYIGQLTHQEIESIPFWIVETHSKDIYDTVVNKFNECTNMKKVEETRIASEVNLLKYTKI